MGFESSVPSIIPFGSGACGRENMASKGVPSTSNPLFKTRRAYPQPVEKLKSNG